MTDRAWMLWSAVPLLLVRWVMVAVAAFAGGLFGAVYALGEMAMLAGGTMNLFTARVVDRRWAGLLVPGMYALGFVIVPVQGPSEAVAAAFVVVTAFRIWCAWYLLDAFTTGVCTWVGLRDSGPYEWVRHPLMVSSVAWRLCVVVGWPHWWNLVGAVVHLAAVVAEIRVEEAFLRGQGEWREYAKRVRWRLVPGVW